MSKLHFKLHLRLFWLLGAGNVQPLLAQLLVPVSLPSDPSVVRDPGVRLWLRLRAVPRGHSGHFHEHPEVRITIGSQNVHSAEERQQNKLKFPVILSLTSSSGNTPLCCPSFTAWAPCTWITSTTAGKEVNHNISRHAKQGSSPPDSPIHNSKDSSTCLT